MNDEQAVDVSLKGSGLDFNYKTSLQKAAQVIAFLSAGSEIQGGQKQAIVELGSGNLIKNTKYTSPLEAVKISEATTYPQKIAALASFVLDRDKRETFDSKEILTLLRRMGDMPKNFTRDLQNAELLGYVTKEPNGEFLLTEHGKQTVESKFSDATSARLTSKKRKTPKAQENPVNLE